MAAADMAITLGDPAPWFSGATVAGSRADLHVDAGRWVALTFPGPLSKPEARLELAALLALTDLYDDSHLVFYAFLREPPPPDLAADLLHRSGPAVQFVLDLDGAIAASFGADQKPRSFVLDAMLRAVATVPYDFAAGHVAMMTQVLRGLPPVADSVGVKLTPPVLIVPRVFEFELCDLLVELHKEHGGSESGFLLDHDGRTATLVDHAYKSRRDLSIGNPEIRELIRDRFVRRLLPAVERFFQFKATRMDRHLVCCYDAASNDHFFRHRDNMNAGARHRRFAVTLNLNSGYEGGDLRFPEFGPESWRAPDGGAIVFSCGMLHEVTKMTRGQRFCFVPFLYGEEDARLRLEMNAHLDPGERQYEPGADQLYPDQADLAG